MAAESSPAASPAEPELTSGERAEARQYRRIALGYGLVDRLLDLVYLGLFAGLAAEPLDACLRQHPLLARDGYLRLAVFFLLLSAGHLAVSLPLAYLSGYRLEHRFRLSRLSLAGWLWRFVKRNGLSLALGLAMVLVLFVILQLAGRGWWLVAAAAFFVLSVVLGQLAPVLILPLFYRIERLEADELAERFRRVAQGTGLAIEGVYRMGLSAETVKANAMLAGLGRTRRVLLGDTLLDHFTAEEIEVIFAHEVGHHVFGHIRKLIVAGACYRALGLWICDRLVFGGHPPPEMPVASLPALLLVLTVFSTLLEPLQNAVSRRFERQCDRYALARTGRAAAYASAFRKLARLNKDDPEPPWLEVVLFHSHPPIAQRVAMAEIGPLAANSGGDRREGA